MPLTFHVEETGTGYYLNAQTRDSDYRISTSEQALRRLLIDLIHTLDYNDQYGIPDPEPNGLDGWVICPVCNSADARLDIEPPALFAVCEECKNTDKVDYPPEVIEYHG